MIKVTQTTRTPGASHQKKRSNGNNRFAEILAEQSAKSRQENDSTLPEDDYRVETNTDEAGEIDARDELIKLLSMDSTERIRYTMLKEMGLTEETLAQLPYAEKQRIEAIIKQEIKRQLASTFDQKQYDRTFRR